MKVLRIIIVVVVTAAAGCAQTEVAKVERAYRALVAFENEWPVHKDARQVHNVHHAQITWNFIRAIPEYNLYQALVNARRMTSAQMNAVIRKYGVVADLFTTHSTIAYMWEVPRRFPLKDLTVYARDSVRVDHDQRIPGAARIKDGFAIRPPLDVKAVEERGGSLGNRESLLGVARRALRGSVHERTVKDR